jgi:uncharacterized membrane protein YoaK (UPF0700 family)
MASTDSHSPAAARDVLLIGLTMSSGAIDAISFLALGKIFTAFMTGNLVFLGLGVADPGATDVARVLVSLAAFATGIFVATRIVRSSRGSGVWPAGVTAALGVALLLEAAFVALWMATSGLPGPGSGDILTAQMAMAMGLQSGAVLALGVQGVFTTAATATVMFLFRDLAAGSGSRATEAARLAGVLVALIAGAAAGGLLLVHARTFAPVLPLVVTALVIATASLRLHGRSTRTPARVEPGSTGRRASHLNASPGRASL